MEAENKPPSMPDCRYHTTSLSGKFADKELPSRFNSSFRFHSRFRVSWHYQTNDFQDKYRSVFVHFQNSAARKLFVTDINANGARVHEQTLINYKNPNCV